MDKAELLREISGVMEKDPDRGYGEFEWKMRRYNEWMPCKEGWCTLLYRADNMPMYNVRRRPRTIKVSGEVSEEAIQAARWLAEKGRSGTWKYSDVGMVSLALLDLVENGGE